MDLPEEPQREREPVFQSGNAVVQRFNVIAYLLDIGNRNSRHLIELEKQQIGAGRSGAFDHGGEHRLLPDAHVQEQSGVG